MFKNFEAELGRVNFDVEPMKFKHKLIGHPTLSLENLAKVLPELPSHQVMYSKALNDLGINFDRAHIDHKNGMCLAETIESIKVNPSYIAVKNPENHASFKELFHDMEDDLTKLIRMKKKGTKAKDAMFWLFIASPDAQTPFHFDRYSNFLMQFRGSKEIAVFPPLDQRVISAEDYEAYIDQTEKRPAWRPEIDHLAQKFHFDVGEALHIPFSSGHYVKNGSEDVSISLSVFFHTDETIKLSNAMRMNHRLRRRMNKIGLTPSLVSKNSRSTAMKSRILPMANLAGGMMSRFR